jgi:hypothetical protein
MKGLIWALLFIFVMAGCSQSEKGSVQEQKLVQQPSFHDRYNTLAKQISPALATRDCIETKDIGRNRDILIECPLSSSGAQLRISGLNNKFTGALLELDVQKLNNPGDLTKAGRILLRMARGKDAESEDPVEMMQMVLEAQGHLGKSACEDTPAQQTRFCIMTEDKQVYHLALVNPDIWAENKSELSFPAKIAMLDAGSPVPETDARVDRIRKALAVASNACKSDEQFIGNVAFKTAKVVRDEKLSASTVELLELIPQIPVAYSSPDECTKTLAMYATVRHGGMSHTDAVIGLRQMLLAVQGMQK